MSGLEVKDSLMTKRRQQVIVQEIITSLTNAILYIYENLSMYLHLHTHTQKYIHVYIKSRE